MGGVGVKAINLFKIGARRGLDVTAGAVPPILKRLIAVNTFVSPWGLKILGWEICVCMEESENYKRMTYIFPPNSRSTALERRLLSEYKSSIRL